METNLKKFNSKILILLFAIAILTLFNCKSTPAQNISYRLPGDGKVYRYQEIFSRFECYSIDYKIEVLDNQLQTAKALTADEAYTGAQADYLFLQVKIQELKTAKNTLYTYRNEILAGIKDKEAVENAAPDTHDSSTTISFEDYNAEVSNLLEQIDEQIAAIDIQIANYESSLTTLGKNSADAKLSKDLSAFYTNNQNLLLLKLKDKTRHNFLRNCLSLMIYQEEMKYYKLNEEYLNIQKDISEIKFRYGLSNNSQLDSITLSILENGSLLLEKQSDYESLCTYLKRETAIDEKDTIQYEFPLSFKNYNLTDVTARFKDTNLTYLQLVNMETSYQSYLYSGGITGSANRHQIELTIDNYRLQKLQFSRQIEDYVKKSLNSYKIAYQKMQTAKTEIDIMEKKCKILEESLKYKKSTKQELYKAYVDKQSVYLKYYNLCMEVILWEDILDNNIYEVS